MFSSNWEVIWKSCLTGSCLCLPNTLPLFKDSFLFKIAKGKGLFVPLHCQFLKTTPAAPQPCHSPSCHISLLVDGGQTASWLGKIHTTPVLPCLRANHLSILSWAVKIGLVQKPLCSHQLAESQDGKWPAACQEQKFTVQMSLWLVQRQLLI